jgi:hypothetical protein
MEQIIVTTQAELDAIPNDYRGLIIVRGRWIYVTNRNRVVARENSSVVARENSRVEAWGNVQIVQYSADAKLIVKGNARIVRGWPQSLDEYISLHEINVRDNQAILYKSVRDDLASHYDPKYQYAIGETSRAKCNTNAAYACSNGLHVSHLAWAIDFGRQSDENFRILECAVPIDKIVLPKQCDGKVRTSKLTVLREVPPSEWGLMGTILGRV